MVLIITNDIIKMVIYMNTIKENTQDIIIINNSKFITNLYKINNKDEINNYLNNIKNIHKDATHYCYAYILDNEEKVSDDGEPSGTAGIPIKEVLSKHNLNHILCIVTRYFGGIKLGAGGLVRAYTKSVSECLKKACITKMILGKIITINFDYNKNKEIDFILKNEKIINKNYDDKITYTIATYNNETINKLKNETNINIINEKDMYIEI